MSRTDGHTSPLQIILNLLISFERFEDFHPEMIRIIGYKIFGGIANLLLPSRAAPAPSTPILAITVRLSPEEALALLLFLIS